MIFYNSIVLIIVEMNIKTNKRINKYTRICIKNDVLQNLNKYDKFNKI